VPTKEVIEGWLKENRRVRDIFLKSPKCPSIIDSRGRILTSKPIPAKPGEF